MMKHMKRRSVLIGGGAIGVLSQLPAGLAMADSMGRFVFNVGRIEIVIADGVEMQPAQALKAWAEKNLIAGDDEGSLLFTITHATLVEKSIADKDSLYKSHSKARHALAELAGEFDFRHPEGDRSAIIAIEANYGDLSKRRAERSFVERLKRRVLGDAIERFAKRLDEELAKINNDNWPLKG